MARALPPTFISAVCSVVLMCTLLPQGFAQSGNAPEAEKNLWAIGAVWSTDKSEILYREFHFADDTRLDLPTRVEYRSTDGAVFAEKTVDYTVASSAPAIDQIDLRNDALIRTTYPDSDTRSLTLEFRAHDTDRIETSTFQRRDDLIIDAGFDPFVRENWERLVNGRRVTGTFLVPMRMDTVRIGISKTDDSDCQIDLQDIHCFVIRPAGLLRVAGWFVDPVLIGYDADSRRLMMFHGLGNLRDEAGEPLNVLIQYEYF